MSPRQICDYVTTVVNSQSKGLKRPFHTKLPSSVMVTQLGNYDKVTLVIGAHNLNDTYLQFEDFSDMRNPIPYRFTTVKRTFQVLSTANMANVIGVSTPIVRDMITEWQRINRDNFMKYKG